MSNFLREVNLGVVLLIQLWNVGKKYRNGTVALQDVNIRVRKGDFAFIVGPSGAGKSTLIKMLYGEELPTSGQIIIAGKNLNRLRRFEYSLLRRNVGVVFQDYKLLPDRTVYENVAFALEVVETSPREIVRRVPAVLGLVGLAGKMKMLPVQLSGGEQQRVALARAIVNNPVVIAADEPTGNLDPDTAWEIMRLLEEINRMGTTVIVGTHAKSIVDAMHKRVIAIEKGQIVRDEERGEYGYEA